MYRYRKRLCDIRPLNKQKHIMKQYAMTPQDVVFATIVEMFNTTDVEQNLSPEASLRDDLKLTEGNIDLLGLTIEMYYQRTGELQHIPDTVIRSWKTCEDIVRTVTDLLKS